MTLLALLRGTVGADHVLTGDAEMAPFLTDWRKRFVGTARAVVQPASAAEVAAVVRVCMGERAPIVPQGGNTGLVGGGTPDVSGNAVLLSLRRMNTLRKVDPLNNTLIAEAGCILQNVQEAARLSDRLFPLSLAAEGSATLGGNLSTNAGGTQVLRYGNARELCLGLEVVTAQGELWEGLRGLRKDNTGYDLRDVFIGAEGTLGVITAACMKIFPAPKAQSTALAAVASVEHALRLLTLAQSHLGPTLTAFELINDLSLGLVERHHPQLHCPFTPRSPFVVLLEISDHEDDAHAQALMASTLQTALEKGAVIDASVAQTLAQRRMFWQLREFISEAQAAEGKNIKHDISLPISRLSEFMMETNRMLSARYAGIRMVTFGHLGDGNLHYNLSPPPGQGEQVFLQQQFSISELVHERVNAYGGSISAEHGIGQLKREDNERYKSTVEMRLMRSLKTAFDPLNLMNPGKLL